MSGAGPGRLPSFDEQLRMVEAVLFAATEPLSVAAIAARLPAGCDVREALAALQRHYRGRGVELVRAGAGFAFRTAADLGFLMQENRVETRRLGRAAVETLAIVAYHQPVTRTEIEEIRGVAVARGTLDLLIEMGWVRMGRRRMTPGRPATFVVTDAFLDHFGLESVGDLPGLAELRAAGLLGPQPAADPARDAVLAPGDEEEDAGDAGGPGDLFDMAEARRHQSGAEEATHEHRHAHHAHADPAGHELGDAQGPAGDDPARRGDAAGDD